MGLTVSSSCFLLVFILALPGPCTPHKKGSREQLKHQNRELARLQETTGIWTGVLTQGEQIPHSRWKERSTAPPSPPEVFEEKESKERSFQTKGSTPWPRGLCPGRGSVQLPCRSWVVKMSLVAALGLVVVVGNGTIIAVIASSVSGWSHSSRLMLLSLAAADAALAVFVVPLNLYHSLMLGPLAEEAPPEEKTSYCRVVAFLNSSIFGASLYSLAGVSLERYVAVFFPLHHQRLLSPQRVGLLIAAAWLLPALQLVPVAVPGTWAVLRVRFSAAALLCEPDYSSNATYSLFIAGTIFCLAAGIITFANLRLWLAARAHGQRGKGMALLDRTAGLKRLHLLPLDTAGRILLPVVVAFYICWVPCIATLLYNYGSSQRRISQKRISLIRISGAITQKRVPEWLEFVALWLPTGSGILNFFVYFWVNKKFRQKFQQIGHQLCRPCHQARKLHRGPRISGAVEQTPPPTVDLPTLSLTNCV